MKKNPEAAFFLSGIIFMLLIVGIKYAVNQDISIIGLLITFLFGGVVGLLAITEKDTFFKNVVFISAFAWVLWAFFNPITSVGNNVFIKTPEFLAIIAIIVIFLERDIFNSINRIREKPGKFGVGFLGTIAIYIFLSKSGLLSKFGAWMGQNPYLFFGIFIAWLIFLYVIINKNFKKITDGFVKRLEKR